MARRACPGLCAYTAYMHQNVKNCMLCFVFTGQRSISGFFWISEFREGNKVVSAFG